MSTTKRIERLEALVADLGTHLLALTQNVTELIRLVSTPAVPPMPVAVPHPYCTMPHVHLVDQTGKPTFLN